MARVNQAAGTELTSEQVVKIEAAQKQHALIDPGCERLSPEEFINWHPVNYMTLEERARLMREAGIVDDAEGYWEADAGGRFLTKSLRLKPLDIIGRVW
jgi:hypothetical protein